MAADARKILAQYWSESRLRMLSPGQRQSIRADLVRQKETGETGSLRAEAQSLINLVDTVNCKEGIRLSDRGPRGALPASMRGPAQRPLEDRVADMREALGKTPNAAQRDVKRRAWDMAVAMCGSAAEAKRRGYKNPAEAQ